MPSQHLTNPRGSISSSSKSSSSSQLASTRYVHQYRALMDHQRKVFDEERELWLTERSELLGEIECLKAQLGQPRLSTSSQISSPKRRQGSGPNLSGFFGPSSTSSFSHTSTGDEFWRGAGGKSDAQATRTFSDPPSQSFQVGERLPSISENESPQSRRSLLTDSLSKANRPGISLASSGDIDGVTFKSSSFASSSDINMMTPQSPSPSRASPGTIPPPASEHDLAVECNTMHAGHTPLARGTSLHLDEIASATSSSPTTPTQPEIERPPHEPRASFVKPPHERSDSYFAGVIESQEEDPALNEPLGLGNRDESATQSFLQAVDLKLEEAAQKEDNQSRDIALADNSKGDSSISDQPVKDAGEPKLRIKRSMNFGTQLGSLH